ncbi:Nn.00g008120.m01.CDS01 [Neocucurbitaria sp. VM-36]
MSLYSQSEYWPDNEIQESEKDLCLRALRERFLGYDVEEFEEQGYCSFTFVIVAQGESSISNIEKDLANNPTIKLRERISLIIQVRPVRYALDLAITKSAKRTYPTLAPHIHMLDSASSEQLCAYTMERMRGTPFSRLQPHSRKLDFKSTRKQDRLVSCYADFIIQGCRAESETLSLERNTRADSPMDDKSAMLSKCTGKVGASIISRLEKLATELPEQCLRDIAKQRLDQIQKLANYPVTLNHGDLIPSNILIDGETWEITGVVDWAEAEYLPFGTCLYGLEHLLGYFSPVLPSSTPTSSNNSVSSNVPEFVYYDHAPQLRALFWSRLLEAMPEMRSRTEEIEIIRDVGVLLWYGIAWDDGAINRVINEVDDVETMAYLRAFLAARS